MDSRLESKKTRFDRINDKISTAANCLFSIAVGLFEGSDLTFNSERTLFGPHALGGLNELRVVAKVVIKAFTSLDGYSDELAKVLFDYLSSDNFLIPSLNNCEVNAWRKRLCNTFVTLVPDLFIANEVVPHMNDKDGAARNDVDISSPIEETFETSSIITRA